ncbi:hypothetical protein [Georgenia yuyongxinii]
MSKKTLLSTTALVALAVGVLATPSAAQLSTAASAPASTALVSIVQPAATYSATVKCQLVRISDNNVIGYVIGYGSGSTSAIAVKYATADANSKVPLGHYKRHCHATIYQGGGGGFSIPDTPEAATVESA